MEWLIPVLFFCFLSTFIILILQFWNSKKNVSEDASPELIRNEFDRFKETSDKQSRSLRDEVGENLRESSKVLSAMTRDLQKTIVESLKQISDNQSVQLKNLQESNEKKLEEMRKTVDEKLQGALEKRLGEAFKQVGGQLETVIRVAGELKNLTSDVGDFKKVLTNVKARGMWGEIQLQSLLEEVMAPSQYEKNVKPIPGSDENVEFAIKLPGSNSQDQVWLPIDAKFPQEDYIRLQDAQEQGDSPKIKESIKALENVIIKSAKDIHDKYISPPYTTNFGILFLPTEGLYAEALRSAKVVDQLQKLRVTLAGPTTLGALLNALRMGFHTLAIEKRSSEVWEVLGAVKSEFGKFGDVLARLKKQLETAQRTIDDTGVRTRVMSKKLEQVEELPDEKSKSIFQISKFDSVNEDD